MSSRRRSLLALLLLLVASTAYAFPIGTGVHVPTNCDTAPTVVCLAGRSGGQTIIGGTGSGQNLILQSTSHATRGNVATIDDNIAIANSNNTPRGLFLLEGSSSGTDAIGLVAPTTLGGSKQYTLPGTQTAGGFWKDAAGDGVLSESTLADADVPDTITLTNITQITSRAHANLGSLGADDHTQYTLRAGRSTTTNDTTLSTNGDGTLTGSALTSGNQRLYLRSQATPTSGSIVELQGPIVYISAFGSETPSLRVYSSGLSKYSVFNFQQWFGSNQAGEDVTIDANSIDTAGEINLDSIVDLFPSAPTPAATPTVTRVMKFDRAYGTVNVNTPTWRGIDISPTVTQQHDSAGTWAYFNAGGTYTRGNDGTPGDAVYTVNGFRNEITFTSALASTPPLLQDAFYDGGIVQQTANSADTTWEQISFVSLPTVKATGSASLEMYGQFGAIAQGTIDDSTSGTLRVGNAARDAPAGCTGDACDLPGRMGFVVRDPTVVGTPTIDNNVGFQCNAMTQGSAIACLRSDIAASGTTRLAINAAGTAPSAFVGPVTGGTDAASTLDLRASAASNYTGPVHIGKGGGTVGAGNFDVMKMLNDGITKNFSGAADSFNFIESSGTITENAAAGALASVYSYNDVHTHQNSGTVATLAGDVGYYYGPTVQNVTSTALTSPLLVGFYTAPVVKTTGSANITITNMSLLNLAATLTPASSTTATVTDLRAINIANPTLNGAGTETITRNIGIEIAALSGGTSNLPILVGESTISNPVSGKGVFGVHANGSTSNRFRFIGENAIPFDLGMVTWTGSTGTQLAADNTQRYFPANDRAFDDTNNNIGPTTSTTEHDVAAPGALTIVAMACALNIAPANGGGTQTRTITLREAGSNTAVACSMSEATASCTWCLTGASGCTSTGTAEAVASGALLDYTATASGTPAASDATCTIWWTLDAF